MALHALPQLNDELGLNSRQNLLLPENYIREARQALNELSAVDSDQVYLALVVGGRALLYEGRDQEVLFEQEIAYS